ncbi:MULTISPECIES: hypothetical protein [Saccharothrix]|nr:hypothetical protein [Saccharothrix sp. CB00851]
MAEQNGNGAVVWRVLLLSGVLLNGIGLVAGSRCCRWSAHRSRSWA